MRSRNILNAGLFFSIVFAVATLIGAIISFAVKDDQVFVHIGKSYYSSTDTKLENKAEQSFFNFGDDSENILSYNIFDAQNRLLTLSQMQTGGGAESGDFSSSSGAAEASADDILYYLENPGKCVPLASLVIGGTIVADEWEQSVALLRDGGRGRSENVYVSRVGDEVTDGIKIGFVWRNLVIFNTPQGVRCIGEGVGEAKPQPEQRVTERGRPEPQGDDDFEIRQVGENQYVIRRQDIQKATGNLNALATQARIVPAKKENGFRILNIRNGSLYQKIGIQNGDVVRSINGIDISSPDKALEAYSRLQSASKISIDIVRRGGNQTLEYTIE
jgi:type II secretion system protein C